MGTNSIIGVIIALVVAVGGYVFYTNQGGGTHNDAMTTESTKEMAEPEKMMDDEVGGKEDDMMEEATEAMKKEDSMMEDEVAMNDAAVAEVVTAGEYVAYNVEKLAMANNGDVVLSFSASWCPSCRALDKDIQANLEDIPADVAILKVDYDQATDLKKKYGVTQQHTFVQVDAAGNQIQKWSGSRTLDELLAKL